MSISVTPTQLKDLGFTLQADGTYKKTSTSSTYPIEKKTVTVNNTGITGFKALLEEQGIAFVPEYRFHAPRRWKFDIAIPHLKIAVEYEGLMSKKSRHTTIEGYSKDSEKYNTAAEDGWTVLRYTALTKHRMLDDVKRIIEKI